MFGQQYQLQVFHYHRELEKTWQDRKQSLLQKHQLKVYENDVQQVSFVYYT